MEAFHQLLSLSKAMALHAVATTKCLGWERAVVCGSWCVAWASCSVFIFFVKVVLFFLVWLGLGSVKLRRTHCFYFPICSMYRGVCRKEIRRFAAEKHVNHLKVLLASQRRHHLPKNQLLHQKTPSKRPSNISLSQRALYNVFFFCDVPMYRYIF